MPNLLLALGLLGLLTPGSVGLDTPDVGYVAAAPAYVVLAAHDGGRGGPPPGKGPGEASGHHEDVDDRNETGHETGHDDGGHEDGHDTGDDEGKRGPRYLGGRGVADLKTGFGHRFDSETAIFQH